MDFNTGIGATIAALNVVVYIVLDIAIFLIRKEPNEKENPNVNKYLIALATFVTIMAVLSIILTIGIIKKLHRLMLPWLILNVIIFIGACGEFIIMSAIALFSTIDDPAFGYMFIFYHIIGLSVFIFIILFMYNLYVDMRMMNKPPPPIRFKNDA